MVVLKVQEVTVACEESSRPCEKKQAATTQQRARIHPATVCEAQVQMSILIYEDVFT